MELNASMGVPKWKSGFEINLLQNRRAFIFSPVFFYAGIWEHINGLLWVEMSPAGRLWFFDIGEIDDFLPVLLSMVCRVLSHYPIC